MIRAQFFCLNAFLDFSNFVQAAFEWFSLMLLGRICRLLAVAFALIGVITLVPATEGDKLATEAHRILVHHCYQCHGELFDFIIRTSE